MVHRPAIVAVLAFMAAVGTPQAQANVATHASPDSDARAIANLMGRRAMYQTRGDVNDWIALFSHRSDVSFFLAGQMTVGLDGIKARFGYDQPPRNVFSEHILASPIIEIAADGQTAKGLWQSFGPVVFPHGQEPQDQSPRGMMNWEDSGVDFIREGGTWKIWHFAVFPDFSIDMGETLAHKLANGAHPGANDPRAAWAPGHTSPAFPVPVPYQTFARTFSYGTIPWSAADSRRQPGEVQ